MKVARSGWGPIRIGQLGRVITGRTPSSSSPELFGEEYPFITPTDIKNDSIYVRTERYLSDKGLQSQRDLLLPSSSICFVCIGATIGKICLTKCPSLTNQQINSIVVDESQHDARFIFHLLRANAERVKGLAGGAATPIVNKTTFSSIQLHVPGIAVQQRIGAVLCAYDDLIENNTRRIEILEQMAQMVYREWFVNFRFPAHDRVNTRQSDLGLLPEGWSIGSVESVCSFISRGISPVYDDSAEGMVINQKCIRDGKLNVALARKQSKRVPAEKMVREGDILINSTGVGTLGRVAQVIESIPNCTVDSHVTIARPKEHAEFVGRALLGLESHFAAQGVGSTGQTELSRERIAATPLIIPRFDIQEAFCTVIAPINKMILCCTKQNAVLRATRDLLLSKLLSGEICVEQLEPGAIAQTA